MPRGVGVNSEWGKTRSGDRRGVGVDARESLRVRTVADELFLGYAETNDIREAHEWQQLRVP